MTETVGARIRAHRLRAGLSMRTLATAAGVSQPFLSQVEHGRSAPSMATVYRLAEALDVAPGDLLPHVSTSEVEVVRAGEGRRLPVSEHPSAAVGRVLAAGLGQRLEVIDYRVAPGEHLEEWFVSGGEAGVYVVEGRMDVEFEGGDTVHLGPGDFLHHPGTARHRWRRADDAPLHVLISIAR